MQLLMRLALVLALGVVGGTALADPTPASDRAAAFERRGKRAYQHKRWDDATAAFELAHRADPQPRYLFNLARCHEMRGDLVKAVELLERYVKEAAAGSEHDRHSSFGESASLEAAGPPGAGGGD